MNAPVRRPVSAHTIFLTGGTGYLGSHLIPLLAERGHRIRALSRPQSVDGLPGGCEPVVGDALDHATFIDRVAGCDTFVQLVGTPRPSPAKALEFERVDLVSARESALAARRADVRHFIYVSVAQPAPVMRAYVGVRMRAEALIAKAGLVATILRPWYVLGPAHRWPYALAPLYWILERLPTTRESALRLGLVTVRQMLSALVAAVENPPEATRVVDVPAIRRAVVAR